MISHDIPRLLVYQRRYDIRHKMLTQHAIFGIASQYKKGHAICDAYRTFSAGVQLCIGACTPLLR